MNRSTNNPWLSRFAALTAVATLGLICLGGLVTSHEAGLSVPDWPTTYGYNMFFFPFSMWVGGIFYEHTHRLLASAVGLMTIILARWLWLKEERRWVRWLGVAAFFLVVLQGVLGGVRVIATLDELGIFHAALAQWFFALVGAIALFTSRWWRESPPLPATALGGLRGWFYGLAALILVQLVVAATMRHQHAGLAIHDFPLAYGKIWPPTDAAAIAAYNQGGPATITGKPITAFQVQLQMIHRLFALFIVGTVAALAWKTFQRLGWKAALTRLAMVEAGLILAQVGLGAATIWTNKAADITTAHVAVGATSFFISVMMILVLRRDYALAPASAVARAHIHPNLSTGPSAANYPA